MGLDTAAIGTSATASGQSSVALGNGHSLLILIQLLLVVMFNQQRQVQLVLVAMLNPLVIILLQSVVLQQERPLKLLIMLLQLVAYRMRLNVRQHWVLVPMQLKQGPLQ